MQNQITPLTLNSHLNILTDLNDSFLSGICSILGKGDTLAL